MKIAKAIAVALLLCPGTVPHLYGQGRDTVYVTGTGPNRVQGQIQAVSADGVVVETNSGRSQVSVGDFDRFALSDDPSSLSNVRNNIRSGNHQQALDGLAKIKVDDDAREVVKQDIEFYRALATSRLAFNGQAEIAEAGRLMQSFIRGNRNSIHYYQANEVMGDLLAAAGLFDKAARFYDQMMQAKEEALRRRGMLLKARVLQRNGDDAAASSLYEELAGQAANDVSSQRTKAFAQIGLAESIAMTGRASEAIPMLEKVIVENDPTDIELFARAHNALGKCYRQLKQPEDAVLAYLYVDTMFFRDADAHAEALFNLTELWPQVNKPNEGLKAREMLKSRYAQSEWAKK